MSFGAFSKLFGASPTMTSANKLSESQSLVSGRLDPMRSTATQSGSSHCSDSATMVTPQKLLVHNSGGKIVELNKRPYDLRCVNIRMAEHVLATCREKKASLK